MAYVVSEEIGHTTERKHCHIAFKGKTQRRLNNIKALITECFRTGAIYV